MHRQLIATAVGILAAAVPSLAASETITANCTGMFDLEVYSIDMEQSSQEVEGIGLAEVSATETAIVLEGDFGVYRFDLEVGTLYHDDKDTGIYCTYSGLDS